MSRRAPTCPESRLATKLQGTPEPPAQRKQYERGAEASGWPFPGTRTGKRRSPPRRPANADVRGAEGGTATSVDACGSAGGVQHESTATCPDLDGTECTLRDGDLRRW